MRARAAWRPVYAAAACAGVFAFAVARAGADSWKTYANCTMMENEFNDGDSFHVRLGKTHRIVRLYFVDAPESEDSIETRVKEQAEYWHIREDESLTLGKEAAEWTRKFLAGGFTVYTKWEDARGRSDRHRWFAMVKVGDRYLSEALVEAGLARVYGKSTSELPDGTPSRTYWARLHALEDAAKKKGVGAWATAGGKRRFGAFSAPVIDPRELELPRATAVYTLHQPPRRLTTLPKGTKIAVVEAVSPTYVRVRFSGADGRTLEGQCLRFGLGL